MIDLLRTKIKALQNEIETLEQEKVNGSNESVATTVHHKEMEEENEQLKEQINATNQRIADLSSGGEVDLSIFRKSKITW